MCMTEQLSCICSNLSSSYILLAPYKIVQLLVMLSNVLPSLPRSSSTPIHLVMEVQGPWLSSVPSSNQPVICWVRAACVGGRPSIVLPFWVKSCFLASFTHSWLLERSYSKTKNCSSGPSHFWTVCEVGLADKAQNAGVTSLYTFQVFIAVQCSFLASASKERNCHCHILWRHGTLAIHYTDQDPVPSCTAKNRKFFPTPKAIHNSAMSSCCYC